MAWSSGSSPRSWSARKGPSRRHRPRHRCRFLPFDLAPCVAHRPLRGPRRVRAVLMDPAAGRVDRYPPVDHPRPRRPRPAGSPAPHPKCRRGRTGDAASRRSATARTPEAGPATVEGGEFVVLAGGGVFVDVVAGLAGEVAAPGAVFQLVRRARSGRESSSRSPRVCRIVRVSRNADPPRSLTVRMTAARSSARRVAIFAAQTGQDHTDPQVSPP